MSEVTRRAGGAAALLAAYDGQMRPAEVANLPAGKSEVWHADWTSLADDLVGRVANGTMAVLVAVTTTTPYVWTPTGP